MINRNPESTAQIAGHPFHPMLVPFPVAFLVSPYVCDVIFWRTGSTAWSTGGLYLLGATLVMAALAAAAGLTGLLSGRKIRDLPSAWRHMIGNLIAVMGSRGSKMVYRHKVAVADQQS